jgi:hypothetical protein
MSASDIRLPFVAKPDPIVIVGYDSDAQLYSAAILGISHYAPRLSDAISGLFLKLGWFSEGPDRFSNVYLPH